MLLVDLKVNMHLTILFRVLVRKDARLLRGLRLMAYFRQCFPSDMAISTIKELARALAAHPPYEVSITTVKIKHLHRQVDPCTLIILLLRHVHTTCTSAMDYIFSFMFL